MKKVELRAMGQIKYKIVKYLVDNNGDKKRAVIKLRITLRQINRLIIVYKKRKIQFYTWQSRADRLKRQFLKKLLTRKSDYL